MSVESCLWNHISDLNKEEVLASMEKHKIIPETSSLTEMQKQLFKVLKSKGIS
jgi:hypothetical protein